MQSGDPKTGIVDQPQAIHLTSCTSIISSTNSRSARSKLVCSLKSKRLGTEESHHDTAEENGSAHVGNVRGIGEGRKGGSRVGGADTGTAGSGSGSSLGTIHGEFVRECV